MLTFKKLTKGLYAKYRVISNPRHDDFGKKKFVGNCSRRAMLDCLAETVH